MSINIKTDAKKKKKGLLSQLGVGGKGKKKKESVQTAASKSGVEEEEAKEKNTKKEGLFGGVAKTYGTGAKKKDEMEEKKAEKKKGFLGGFMKSKKKKDEGQKTAPSSDSNTDKQKSTSLKTDSVSRHFSMDLPGQLAVDAAANTHFCCENIPDVHAFLMDNMMRAFDHRCPCRRKRHQRRKKLRGEPWLNEHLGDDRDHCSEIGRYLRRKERRLMRNLEVGSQLRAFNNVLAWPESPADIVRHTADPRDIHPRDFRRTRAGDLMRTDRARFMMC